MKLKYMKWNSHKLNEKSGTWVLQLTARYGGTQYRYRYAFDLDRMKFYRFSVIPYLKRYIQMQMREYIRKEIGDKP